MQRKREERVINPPSISYCRCCFKLINHSHLELPDSSIVLESFEEMFQISLETSPHTPNFCVECYNVVGSFKRFKNLAIMRQEKYRELRASCSSDFTNLFFMTWESTEESGASHEQKPNTDLDLYQETWEDSQPLPSAQLKRHASSYEANKVKPLKRKIDPSDDDEDEEADDLQNCASPRKKIRNYDSVKRYKFVRSSSINREQFELVFDFDAQEFRGKRGQIKSQWMEFYKENRRLFDADDKNARFWTRNTYCGARDITINTYHSFPGCLKRYRIIASTLSVLTCDPIVFRVTSNGIRCCCFSEPSVKNEQPQNNSPE